MAGSFFRELKRRNVFRVAIIYVVVSWLLMQIGDVMFPALRLPDWTTTLLVAFLILGFPMAIIFAWAFEMTPDGVVRTSEVPEGQSITADTGRKINYTIIAALSVAVVFLLVKDALQPDSPAPVEFDVADQSIAVLPFKNQSASAENAEFFAGGLHDELLTLLSKLGDLKVISRTSVERIDPNLTIPEIGKLLGVATVLEGQVQRAGDRLRINVQLIDTTQESHIWANTYDSELTAENVFDVQSDIARTITNALHAELSPNDEMALQAVPTTNTDALEKYLLAMQIAKRRTFDALQQAETYLVEVTTLDASFADAWSGLASVRGELFATGAISEQRYVDKAGLAVEKALALEPHNTAALTEYARVLAAMGEFERAENSFRSALDLTPRDPEVRNKFGEWLRIRGRLDEARDMLAAGLEYDPLSPHLMFQLGRVEMFLGNTERNIELGNRIVEMDPSIVYGYVALLQANLWLGRYGEAWPWYVKTIATDPGDYEIWGHIAVFFEDLGAEELADRYIARAETLGPGAPVVTKSRVIILANRGLLGESAMLANRMLTEGFDNRWDSDRVLLRAIRDDALTTGDVAGALERYRQRAPELFAADPDVNTRNASMTADLAMLMQVAGDNDSARRLLDQALRWYDDSQPEGVYGYHLGLVKAELLAVSGQQDRAMTELHNAIDRGFRWQWRWALAGKNFDALRERPEFQALVAETNNAMAAELDTLLALPHFGEFDLRDRPVE